LFNCPIKIKKSSHFCWNIFEEERMEGTNKQRGISSSLCSEFFGSKQCHSSSSSSGIYGSIFSTQSPKVIMLFLSYHIFIFFLCFCLVLFNPIFKFCFYKIASRFVDQYISSSNCWYTNIKVYISTNIHVQKRVCCLTCVSVWHDI